MVKDQGDRARASDATRPPLFIDGFFTEMVKAGHKPYAGYPSNHLPVTTQDRMEFTTSFMA